MPGVFAVVKGVGYCPGRLWTVKVVKTRHVANCLG